VDAFDADVIIYAIIPAHPLGARVRALFPAGSPAESGAVAGVGSVLLVPEVLSRPLRDGASREVTELTELLARLELYETDRTTADYAAALGASYRLRAADAVHLSTAVIAGADRFITNNVNDFPKTITEIDVTYPEELPDPVGR